MGIGRWEAEARDDRKKQETIERSTRRTEKVLSHSRRMRGGAQVEARRCSST